MLVFENILRQVKSNQNMKN